MSDFVNTLQSWGWNALGLLIAYLFGMLTVLVAALLCIDWNDMVKPDLHVDATRMARDELAQRRRAQRAQRIQREWEG